MYIYIFTVTVSYGQIYLKLGMGICEIRRIPHYLRTEIGRAQYVATQ